MKHALMGLMLAQILLLVALAAYVIIDMSETAQTAAMITPLEPPMSRLAGLAP